MAKSCRSMKTVDRLHKGQSRHSGVDEFSHFVSILNCIEIYRLLL